ncbi:MAG TPA: BTAD domain-containing putative transcriptional regulator, partial [Streptosporangiaceae bacterium]|nr:BTAD domain-containing putative transcriptional regulator [Streptosporangiaceae bacterium]
VVVRVLGPVEVRAGESWLAGPPQHRVILAVLALQAGQVVPVGELVDAVWEEEPPRSAQASIQVLVTGLRRALTGLPGAGVERCGDGYRLRIAPGEVDAQRFRWLVRTARQAGDSHTALAAFDQALALWRGPALADVAGTAKIEAIRAGLSAERLSAMQDRVSALLHLGRDREAAEELAALLAANPLAERLAGMLMVALCRSARKADALQVFRDMRERLAGELAVEPGSELQRLHQRILAGDLALEGPGGDAAPSSWAPASPEELAVGGGVVRVVPRQLPAAVAHFTGRGGELSMLSGALERLGRADGTVVISAIGGTPGVGKTALAVHWAHQVAELFPDGQLYVNLRGFGPSGLPLTAGEAVCGFLESLGISRDRIPAGTDAQAGLYRSMLAGRRVLVVLDNAADEAQVRPLLPGSAGCLAVVTSRRPLPGLAAAEGALQVSLDLMSEAEAGELLAARLGADRVAAEPSAVSELAALCARLPLALAVAAVRAASSPSLALTSLTEQLRDMRGRLDALDADDPGSSIRAVFSWSYQNLSGPAARMFRLLGTHPGPDISLPAAASLAGVPCTQARRILAELTGTHLLTQDARGRYAFHDLLRAYAMAEAQGREHQAEQLEAMHRMLDHYLHTAWAASILLCPGRDPAFVLAAARPGTEPETITDGGHALAWFEAEHQVLLAVITQAAAAGFDAHAWQLPWALADYFSRRGHWQDQITTQRTALAAARHLGDRAAQARAHHGLGCAQSVSSAGRAGHAHLAQALCLYRELGDRLGQSSIHLSFAMAFDFQHRPDKALDHARQVLTLARATGHAVEEANALITIGWLYAELGDYPRALAHCRPGLDACRDLGDRNGEAATWDSLGYVEHHLGNYDQATTCYEHALKLSRDLGNLLTQAVILDHVGDAREAAGDTHGAGESWRQSLAILDDLHHPDAMRLRRKARHPGVSSAAPLGDSVSWRGAVPCRQLAVPPVRS